MLARLCIATVTLTLALLPAHAQHGSGQHGGQHGGGQHGGQHGTATPMPAPRPEAIDVPATGATLPMQDVGGRVVVQVKINGKGPYAFVLGSSSTLTVIDSALNNELRLPVAEGMQAAPTGGVTPVIVQVDRLAMGDAVIRGFIGAVMPLGNLLGTGPGAPRGIISAALFGDYLLTYDYPQRRVSLVKGKIEKADKLSTFEYSESRPTLPVRVGGRETRVGVDTGTAYSLTLPNRWLQEMQLAAPARQNGTRRTTAGEFPVMTAALSDPVEIGQYKLPLKEINFSDARATSGPATGSVGNELLKNFVVTLDVWNRRIRLAQ